MLIKSCFYNFSRIGHLFLFMHLASSMDAPRDRLLREEQIGALERDDIKRLTEMAQKGDFNAAYELADKYFTGRDCPRDPHLAEQWLKKAADGGHLKALYRLGKTVQRQAKDDVYGREKKIVEAGALYTRAAHLGEPLSMYEVSRMFKPGGWGSVVSLENEVKWLDKLMQVYIVPGVYDGEYEKIVKIVQAEGACRLGDICLHGEGGFMRAPAAAGTWYNKALKFSDSCDDAWYKLAYMYMKGIGVEKDLKEAREHLLQAETYPPARALLGEICREEMLYEQAIKHYNAALPLPEAHYGLGILCESGLGTVRDINHALAHFADAAKKGHKLAYEKLKQTYGTHVGAQYILGEIELKGFMGEINERDAVTYFSGAYCGGNDKAFSMLICMAPKNGDAAIVIGDLYKDGKVSGYTSSVSLDFAYKYYLMAAEAGNDKGIEKIELLGEAGNEKAIEYLILLYTTLKPDTNKGSYWRGKGMQKWQRPKETTEVLGMK